MKLEILVATMAQKDFSLVEKMNLQSDTIIANQDGRWDFAERKFPCGAVKMLTSDTKGVGRNRNLALEISEGDLLLFADDDMRYYDGLVEGLKAAFRSLPQADVILFSTDISKNGQLAERRHHPIRRRRLWNSLRFGTYCIAIRRTATEKHRLRFSTLFGGGCLYGSGEDSLFLRDCFAAGLQVWSHSFVIGCRSKDTSSWFAGYNEKFFRDKGALMAALSPKLSCLFCLYFLLKNRHTVLQDTPFRKAFSLMHSGVKDYKRKESDHEVQHHRTDL